jgi:hypothetical protein
LGSLTAIRIDAAVNISGGVLYYDNDSSSALTGNLEFGKVYSMTYTQDVSLHNSAMQMIFNNGNVFACNSSAYNLAADNGDGKYNYDYNPPDGGIYYGDDLAFLDSDFIGSEFWNKGTKGFIGTGTYDILYSVNEWIDFASGNSYIEYYSSPGVYAEGSLTVTYFYDPVPEPSVVLLLMSGIVFLKSKTGSC